MASRSRAASAEEASSGTPTPVSAAHEASRTKTGASSDAGRRTRGARNAATGTVQRCYFARVAQVNPLTREVLLKIVYYGPGLGGKTTSLQSIHAAAPPETRGNIVSLATPVDRTLYFDFMPLRVASVRGHPVRVQLFTVPGQVYFNATRKLLLTGADGVVFVADSQRDRLDANVESLENLEANLAEQGRELKHVPHVIQLNKRDLRTVAPVAELERTLNLHAAPVFPTCAPTGAMPRQSPKTKCDHDVNRLQNE